jgi:hypothetical protein
MPIIGLNRNDQLSQTPDVKPNAGMISNTAVMAANTATNATVRLEFAPIGRAIVHDPAKGRDLNLIVIRLSKYCQVVTAETED